MGHRRDLERLAQKGTLADLLHREARDEAARLRHDIDQPLGREPRNRLGHRAARDAEARADLGLAQHLARAQRERQDRVLERAIDPLGKRALKPLERGQNTRLVGVWRLQQEGVGL
jgi:hypothetical protein